MADCPERLCHCSSPPQDHHDPKPYYQDVKVYNSDPKPLPRQSPAKTSSSSGTGTGTARLCMALVAFFVLLGIIALILYLVYRPTHARFSVTSFAILSLSNSSSPFTCVSTSTQVTILIQNPNKHSSINYDCLSVFLSYRNQAITYSTQLPALAQKPRSSLALSPVVGGGAAVPVSYDVMEGLMTDETYGFIGLRLVVQGRIRFQSGPFYGRWVPLYVRCDMLIGARKGFMGQVPVLGNPNCYVDP
ncbi:NDR1/HIN1-like protein 12 [Carex rostrata]